MIAVFGRETALDASPIPAELAVQLGDADAAVVLDPLSFPFEALPAQGCPALVLRFDSTVADSPEEIWQQLGEVVLSSLTADEIVIGSDELLALLHDGRAFGATTGRADSIDADAVIGLAESIDNDKVVTQRSARELVRSDVAAAVAEVPRGRQPEAAWVDGGASFLASELADLSVSAEHSAIDIGIVSFALAAQTAAQQRTTITTLWSHLRPGGSLLIIDSVSVPVEGLLQTIADATNRQATLANLTTKTPKKDTVSEKVTVSGNRADRSDFESANRSIPGAGPLASGQSAQPPGTVFCLRVRKLGGVAALERVEEPRNQQSVFVVANDVVPGLGMPTAAPGLRATGFVAGLRANGVDATLVTPVGNRPSPWQSEVPPPAHADSVVVRPVDLRSFFETRAPATVIITNSNVIDHVVDLDGIDMVFDLFAPKVLELECSVPPAPVEQVDKLRARKASALRAASAYVVNGDKKRPYLNQWLSDAGVDPAQARVVGAKMTIEGTESMAPSSGPLRLAITGYVQRWSQPGSWLGVVVSKLNAEMVLSTVLAAHWGDRGRNQTPEFDVLRDSPWVRTVPPLEFEAFAKFLSSQHVVIDLFDPTAERELAMVTRTVVALASGTPVVHPPFTEVSPLIAEYDAGWLIDPAGLGDLADLLDHLVATPEAVAAKAQNARRLWADHFAPKVATAEMADLLVELEQERSRS